MEGEGNAEEATDISADIFCILCFNEEYWIDSFSQWNGTLFCSTSAEFDGRSVMTEDVKS